MYSYMCVIEWPKQHFILNFIIDSYINIIFYLHIVLSINPSINVFFKYSNFILIYLHRNITYTYLRK